MSTPSSQAAIVLLSGGLDSTVAMAEVLAGGFCVAQTLTFDYGQRAALREIQSARLLAEHYGVPHRAIELPWLSALLPAALNRLAPPSADPGSADWMAVERVWVPNRNGVFLNIAAAVAEAHGAAHVVFGANAEEGAAFPDNTEAYRDRLNEALAYSTLNRVQVLAPVAQLDKEAIIRRALALGVPLALIWSCYEGGDIQCGQCPSCLRVKAAQARMAVSAGIRFGG